MIGELNASHTGVSGPPTAIRSRAAIRPATSASRWRPDAGGYRGRHIYRDGPADKEWINLKAGDYVTAIDGTPIKAGDNYWQLLNSPLNDYVTVTVAGAPAGAAERDGPHPIGRRRSPTSSTRSGSRRTASSSTRRPNGQIAYVHIHVDEPAVAREVPERDQPVLEKKGIIVDIRYNGGGNTDQELIDILERRPYEYWNSRWGARDAGAAGRARRSPGRKSC